MPVKYKRLTADQKRANLEKRRIKEGRAQPKKNGRPKAEISLAAAEQLAQLDPTEKELAAGLGVTYATLARRLKEEPALREAIERGRASGMLELRELQWGQARKDGAAAVNMIKFMSGPILGQYDRPVETHKTVDVNVTVSGDGARLVAKLDDLSKRLLGPVMPVILDGEFSEVVGETDQSSQGIGEEEV